MPFIPPNSGNTPMLPTAGLHGNRLVIPPPPWRLRITDKPHTRPAAIPGSRRVAARCAAAAGRAERLLRRLGQLPVADGAGWGVWGQSAGSPGTRRRRRWACAPAPGTGWSSFTQPLPPQGFGAAGRVWRVSDGHAVRALCAHVVGLADALGGRSLCATHAKRALGCEARRARERDAAPECGGGA